ncbi:MAG: MBL fold metallo-hydrolase [Candidatus Thermoplasmatota archaeon]|nr:MBL fold metallo-hydrolase [Candidatus Thermoplasmatota archaeon]
MDICTIPGKDYDSNVYVIRGKIPTIIDTGTGFYSRMILETIGTILPLPQVKQIVLTHEHYDHVGGVLDFVQATKGTARILAHKDIVLKLMEGKSTFAEMLGGVMPRIEVDVPLSDEMHITMGDETVQVLLTPGHSIGSLCLYDKEQGVLFSGDTVFAYGGFGRYDFPGGDFQLLLHSIERLATLSITKLYPGHGPAIETQGATHVLKSLQNIRSLM